MLAFDLWNPTARCRGCFDGGFDRIESESQKKKKRLRGNERGAKEAKNQGLADSRKQEQPRKNTKKGESNEEGKLKGGRHS